MDAGVCHLLDDFRDRPEYGRRRRFNMLASPWSSLVDSLNRPKEGLELSIILVDWSSESRVVAH